MAEIKTGIFAKNVQKRLNRAQEKVLQKLGKADETKDEQFEQTVQNFKRQESEGSRLQRELRAYLAAVKGMQQASMNLTESLHEVYEPDWHGKDDVMTIGKNCDELWEDFHERLVDSTVNALENYLVQFPDLKTRVSKRARKLIDYDSARHHLETLQASNMRSERKTMKAEEDLKKAQKVFDDLNVGLQDELPTLWDSRVGFYVNTFKSITSLEAKFHREISLLCHKLYEVMNRLAEQHSDKMFTIQGAPSDSGPLRLARTPSPPDDSPPESPDASPNHMLRPTSPGPPRPKSPSQSEDLKKGPPVRPPPMVTPTPTPTKEIQQEQIIDLFDSAFPVPAPCTQPNERPGESLLDLDFDAFPTTPAGQSTSQNLPWDMWTGNAAAAQPQLDSGSWAEGAASQGEGEGEGEASASANSSLPAFPDQAADTAAGFGGGAGFTADWSANFAADFGASAAGTEGADPFGGAAADPFGGAAADPFAGADGAAAAPASDGGWPPASGWGATEATQPPAAAAETAGGDEVANNAFNGFPQTDSAAPAFAADFDKMAEGAEGAEAVVATEAPEATEGAEGQVTTPPAPAEAAETAETVATSPPGEKAPTPAESPVSADNVEGTQTEIPAPDEPEKEQPIHEAPESAAVPEAEESPTAEAPASPDDKGSPIEEAPAEVAKPAGESGGGDGNAEPEAEPQPKQEAGTVEVKAEEAASAAEAKPVEGAADSVSEEEKMPIPSVVIEPASSNEGDDDRDVDILSPTTTSDNGVPPTSDAPSGMPPGFLYKVEAMHDFDAENTDELNLKQGDMVLVVPTSQSEDQDAGWLTGMREVDWHQQGALAKKGLFPENFVQRVD
ncbi:amphiphysin isoform X2 [Alosa sapidissima]|uniref:amphiphysin isoform X2 n=1 Tax=Alosa sapidissima TaxID=34773 RepID=UPI001C090909|nr:amphiphysin isoform X2 [Alosa sapidissima]